MSYIVKQKDIEVLLQSDKTLFYKLELLNEDLKVIDVIEGNLINDNLSIDANSDIRRTYSCELFVENRTFDIGYDKRIWNNKRIRPYIGILHNRSQEVVWYLIGTFLFTDTNFMFNETNKTLSVTCNDMMCLLNGTMGGNLSNYKRTIKKGTDSRAIIIELLKEVGITKYFIEFNLNNDLISSFKIPYDMVYNAGMNAYQIIKEIVDLYPGTEMYFSKDGTFMIDAMPTRENEPFILNDDILKPILIDEQLSTSLKDIYNHIEIWGKINEPEYYSSEVTCTDNIYHVHLIVHKLNEDTGEYSEIEFAEEINNFETFCLWIPETNKSTQYININNIGNVLIVDDEGKPLQENYLNAGRDNVFRYRKEDNTFIFVGEYQVHSELYLTNDTTDTNQNAVIDVNNEHSIEKIGDKLKVLSGGDFDKIPTTGLCRDRCKYELYNATNRQTNLSLQTLYIPFIDVNQIIEFTSNLNNKKEKYLINTINCNFSNFTANITANKYYADYIGS